ncbi:MULTISPECIES: ferrochelatase [Photorhabdus]|uniref:Ferrochelatase n=2 Tax=Photorhabdus TaxID=29487 RepID=A0ABX0AW40_9GAMM|nr:MULTISPECIES: ferrochelatase [Photorhabdus]MCC8372582.1 ferrochelatase [Photorhabdus bodei]MCC8465185.1 ferrochelatase [Photorhabdus bodei]MCT8351140.1 ferrochelatase [Photorhabdus kayaii]MDB6367220.1 ferrochelatase [Photorhabdus bodei]MDB6370549.1 ferrochelatase [Photorhabdus bodei]
MNNGKFGVLLVNLGTPDKPTTAAIRRYLAEFLSDKRVIDLSRFIWKPILYGFVLPFRSSRVAKLYQKIWTDEGSPLLVHGRRQQKLLAERLADIPVELGMNYGSPSLEQAIDNLLKQNVEQLIVLPLYPQYSGSSSAAVFDGVSLVLQKYRTIPGIHFIRSYADHPAYISALKETIEQSFDKHGQPDRLLLSYHGIPQRFVDTGDIYAEQCKLTTRLLKQAINYPAEQVMMAYQSRFGREQWLTPYVDQTMQTLPNQGIKHIQVLCPGFSSDCLETLEEIKQLNKEMFLNAGGEKFEYIPALNDNASHILLLEELVNGFVRNRNE